MAKYEKGNLYWFISLKDNKQNAIGFLRGAMGKALIIGGPTGSHMTGHQESWRDFLLKIRSQGYIEESEAKKQGIISDAWQPPSLSLADYELVKIEQSFKIRWYHFGWKNFTPVQQLYPNQCKVLETLEDMISEFDLVDPRIIRHLDRLNSLRYSSKELARIQLSILKLCEGKQSRVPKYVDLALADPQKIIAAAE
jgi:hypothetical protein